MSLPPAVRRLAIFAGVLGGGLALLALLAEPDTRGPRTAPPTPVRPAEGETGPLTRIEDGPAVGRGARGRLERDAVAVVGGVPVPYRAYTLEWDRSEPVPATGPEPAPVRLEVCRLVLYPRPSAEVPDPRAAAGEPGSLVAEGREGLVHQRPDRKPRAELRGDVLVTHYLGGDGRPVTLATEALDVDGETRTVTSVEPVLVEADDFALAGRGLTADLSEGIVSAEVASDVRGRFAGTRTGALAGEATITCSGRAELVALDRGAGRRAEGARRWRVTFHDDVRVVQAGSELACDELVVEFRNAAQDQGGGGLPGSGRLHVERSTATGNVVVTGPLRDGGEYRITAPRARSWAEEGEANVVVFDGGTHMTFLGTLGSSEDGAAPALHDVRAQSATLRSRPAAGPGGGPSDGAVDVSVLFEEQVVARQLGPDGESVLSRLEAPRVTVLGRRLGDGRPDYHTLLAENGATLAREDVEARARTITWSARTASNPERIVLERDATATFLDRSGGNPFGSGTRSGVPLPAELVLTARDRIEVRLTGDREGPPEDGRPYATAAAEGDVVVRRIVAGEETARLTSDRLDATFAERQELHDLSAYGNARFAGRGEDEEARQGEVEGERIHLVRLPAPVAGGRRPVELTVHAGPRRPALGVVREPDGRRHEVRAQELRYEERGERITARRGARAELAVRTSADRPADSPMQVEGEELVVELERSAGTARGGKLRTVTATGAVRLHDAQHEVTGDHVVYEALTGKAEATGRPATLARREDAAPRYRSLVEAPLVRAFFDPSLKFEDGFRSASCPQGGMILRYVFDERRGGGAAKEPERVRVYAKGPIELERRFASATSEVQVLFDARDPATGGFKQLYRLDADRVTMAFDPEAPGETMDKLTRLEAFGTPERQVRVETETSVAHAERVVAEPAQRLLHLASPSGRSRCFVDDRATGRRFFCDRGSWNWEERTWVGVERMQYVESR